MIDPDFERPLRPVAGVAQLEFGEAPDSSPDRSARTGEDLAADATEDATPPRPASAKRANGKPAVPAWEDVLLGVRTSGER